MKSITIEGQLRTGFGKRASRQLRSQGLVPGVIYGGSKEISFHATEIAFKKLIYTPEFQIADVQIGDTTYHTIIKDLQFDKLSDKLTHVDLLELVEGKKIIADIPLKFVGNPIGVKDGGKFVPKMKSLRIKTLPKFLREQIEVNIDKLEINGNVRVEDVKVENMEIINSPRIPIASVVTTRQLRQEESTSNTAAPVSTKTAAPAAAKAAVPAAAKAAAPAKAKK